MAFELTGAARDAYNHDGRILVLGGPGSGKTTLSLLKTRRLIPNLKPGQEVLFLSFSRAAVRQVLIRCRDVLSSDARKSISVQTYHAFCMDVLRAHGRLLTGTPTRILFPDREQIRRAAFDGTWADERQRLARDDGVYAFDEFAAGAERIIGGSRSVADLISSKYPVIILDEFQDTSNSQWELVQRLAERSVVLMLADADQHIFEYDKTVDPKRLDQVRELLSPAEFDLGEENHRSPDSGILGFADAVLRNRPLPETDDVLVRYVQPYTLEAMTHAGTSWLYGELRKAGVVHPSIAVLARSNPMIADVSTWLGRMHKINGHEYRPLSHDVVWDRELSAAAAQVIASILEWPLFEHEVAVGRTSEAISAYYEVKNAVSREPIASAQQLRDRYRTAATAVRDGRAPRPGAAKHLVASCAEGHSWTGDPSRDWLGARHVLEGQKDFGEIVTNGRYLRLFGATDEIGGRLSEQWDRTGNYTNAADLVRRTLDQGRLVTEQREPRGIVLMSIHKSKGKEFDGVLLVEGQYKAKFFDDRSESSPYMAARRLLRVGITRARKRVVIVRPTGSLPLTGGYS